MTEPRHVAVGDLSIGNDRPLTLIAGPCAIESRAHALETAEALAGIAAAQGIGLIYKSSFDKANRTSLESPRGIGMVKGLAILAEVREAVGCPVITDVHLPDQCAAVAEAVDVLQIPAYLCRQTDLIVAAAETGRPLNIKKGQFLAPWDMVNVVAKAEQAGNRNVMVCERGASFGYNTLVSDMRSLPVLAETGCRSSSTRPTRCSSRAAKAGVAAASASSCRSWRAPRSPWASPPSSWRRTRIPTARRATAPTWCRSPSCQHCWRASSRSTD